MNWRHIKPFLWGGTTILGLALLYWVLRRYDLADLSAAIASFPRLNLVAATLFTLGSIACLSAGEMLGARYAGLRVPPARNALVVLAALGIGHSIGLAALSSGAVRLRMYGRSGGRPDAVARLLLFAGITIAFGLLLTASWATLARSDVISDLLGISPATAITVLGLLPLAVALAYVAACRRYEGTIFRLWRLSLPVPPARLAAGQLLAGTANFLCVSAALYFCLAPFNEAA